MKSSSKLESDHDLLGELYKARWEQVRHINDLDQRSIIMVGSAIASLLIAYNEVLILSPVFASALCLLSGVICIGSISSVIHNRLSFEYYISSIDQMESQINKIYKGLFPMAGNYSTPRSFHEFLIRVISSIRGPIILIFTVALAEITFIGLYTNINWFTSPYNMLIPLLISIIIAIIIPLWFLREEYKSAEKMFASMNKVMKKIK